MGIGGEGVSTYDDNPLIAGRGVVRLMRGSIGRS
jgi:hypothetical protein